MPGAEPSEPSESRLASLIEANRLLMEPLEPEALLRAILESVMKLFRAEGASIGLVDEAAGKLAFTTIAGPAGVDAFSLDLGQGIAGWVAGMGEAVISNDVTQDARFFGGIDARSGFKTRNIACVPLESGERTAGALEVLNTAAVDGFDAADLELLDAFGGLAVTALVRSRDVAQLQSANAALVEDSEGRHGLVSGGSPAMEELLAAARTAAGANTAVLVLGESGVGKEIVARAIHRWSPRAAGPFVAVNCVAAGRELLERELFGHEYGAITGATTGATGVERGRFELADGGTIFLDEIGDLAPDLQVELLRVLQERRFQRVGGERFVPVDVRVIAATHRDLREAVRDGGFREDLFYRLNVVSLRIPPLRERRDDIRILSARFLERFARELGRPDLALADDALAALARYAWPGNVRELQNAIERAAVLGPGPRLGARDLPVEVREGHSGAEAGGGVGSCAGADADGAAAAIDSALPLGEAVDAFKQMRIERALEASGGNQTRAAAALGMRQSNLSRLMGTLGMRRPASD